MNEGTLDIILIIDCCSTWITKVCLSEWYHEGEDNCKFLLIFLKILLKLKLLKDVMDVWFSTYHSKIYKTKVRQSSEKFEQIEEVTILVENLAQSITTLNYINGYLIWSSPGSIFYKSILNNDIKEIQFPSFALIVGIDKYINGNDDEFYAYLNDGLNYIFNLSLNKVNEEKSKALQQYERKRFEHLCKNVLKIKNMSNNNQPNVNCCKLIPNTSQYLVLFSHTIPEDIEYFQESQRKLLLSIFNPSIEKSSDINTENNELNNNRLSEFSHNVEQSLMNFNIDIWKSPMIEIGKLIETFRTIMDNDSNGGHNITTQIEDYFKNLYNHNSNLILKNYDSNNFRVKNASNVKEVLTQSISCDFWTIKEFDLIRRSYLLSYQFNNVLPEQSFDKFQLRQLQSSLVVTILTILCQRLVDYAKLGVLQADCQSLIFRIVHCSLYLKSSTEYLKLLAIDLISSFDSEKFYRNVKINEISSSDSDNNDNDINDPLRLDYVNNFEERCPATNEEIIFDNIFEAKTNSGFSWRKLS